MISPVRSGWPTMLPSTWNRSPMAACISPLLTRVRALLVHRRTCLRCATSLWPVSTSTPMADTRQCGRCAREQPACRGALRGFVLRYGGLAGFVAGLDRLVARAGPMAGGLKHQDDPDRQQHQQDESQERDR